MSTDWYRRKLGGGQPLQRHSTPPLGPPPMAPMPQQTQTYEPNYPAPVMPQAQHPALEMDEQGRVKVGDAIKVWGGGEGTKTEKFKCPNCGSNNFFTRAKNGSFGKPPAPRCFDCNYNGMWEQYGSAAAE